MMNFVEYILYILLNDLFGTEYCHHMLAKKKVNCMIDLIHTFILVSLFYSQHTKYHMAYK